MTKNRYSELSQYQERLSSAFVNSIRLGNKKQAYCFLQRWQEIEKMIAKEKGIKFNIKHYKIVDRINNIC
jgi:hypothetical protein